MPKTAADGSGKEPCQSPWGDRPPARPLSPKRRPAKRSSPEEPASRYHLLGRGSAIALACLGLWKLPDAVLDNTILDVKTDIAQRPPKQDSTAAPSQHEHSVPASARSVIDGFAALAGEGPVGATCSESWRNQSTDLHGSAFQDLMSGKPSPASSFGSCSGTACLKLLPSEVAYPFTGNAARPYELRWASFASETQRSDAPAYALWWKSSHWSPIPVGTRRYASISAGKEAQGTAGSLQLHKASEPCNAARPWELRWRTDACSAEHKMPNGAHPYELRWR
eukprot:TRINITY_DN21233_c4_g1_i1.p1 TRINITY_DN21233_c4_g1~~TRINITY_DN21233_c4_g1_i1.p1  ORF type:complete len:280 (-),score=44.23 TRINITY_DN21233_c4_g1_i1:77-916(-)